MSKLIVGSLLLLVAGRVASGSLFGLFGPFGPPALPGSGATTYPGAGFAGRPVVGQLPAFSQLRPPGSFLPLFGAGSVAAPVFTRTAEEESPVAAAALPAAAGGSLRTVVSNSDVVGRLLVADLPEDLQQRAQELQLASEQGFNACEELLQVPGAYWQYKRCNAVQLRGVLTAAKALEQEATVRAAAVAATDPSVVPVTTE